MSQDPEDPKGSGELALPSPDVLASAAEAKPPPEPPKRKYPVVTVAELRARPRVPCWVEGLLKPGGIGFFYGRPKSGKTFCVLDLAAMIAKGYGAFAGEMQLDGIPKTVLYMTTEGVDSIPERLESVIKRHELDQEEEGRLLVIDQNIPNLGRPGTVDLWLSELAEQGIRPKVIIWDTLARATSGSDTNSNQEADLHIEELQKVREHFGREVVQIIIHHANKQGEFRNSTSYLGAADFIVKVYQDEGKIGHFLQSEGMKSLPEFGPYGFTLEPDGISAYVQWDRDLKPSARKAGKQPKGDAMQRAADAVSTFAPDEARAKTAPDLCRLWRQAKESEGYDGPWVLPRDIKAWMKSGGAVREITLTKNGTPYPAYHAITANEVQAEAEG